MIIPQHDDVTFLSFYKFPSFTCMVLFAIMMVPDNHLFVVPSHSQFLQEHCRENELIND